MVNHADGITRAHMLASLSVPDEILSRLVSSGHIVPVSSKTPVSRQRFAISDAIMSTDTLKAMLSGIGCDPLCIGRRDFRHISRYGVDLLTVDVPFTFLDMNLTLRIHDLIDGTQWRIPEFTELMRLETDRRFHSFSRQYLDDLDMSERHAFLFRVRDGYARGNESIIDIRDLKKKDANLVMKTFSTLAHEFVRECEDSRRRSHRLEQEIMDQETMENTGIMDYISLFPVARSMKRRFIYHAGPTNSGKTYLAMKHMMDAASGVYLAPLRLMAMEAYGKLASGGIPAIMKTGEEIIADDGAMHVASTIEMLDTGKGVDVAIIDEAQMILDRDRGWAWTHAIVGCPAKTIYLTGSPEAVSHIETLVNMMGDAFIRRDFQRLSPLEPVHDFLIPQRLLPGDAIIAFSRRRVIEIRDLLTAHGISTSCIYGSLGPEVRRHESAKFASGQSQVLIATDAIGMGLNLPIRRVLFSGMGKFDGVQYRRLTPYEVRQIAGRAGRYGHVDSIGVVSMFLDETDRYPVSASDYEYMEACVRGYSPDESIGNSVYPVMPLPSMVSYISDKYQSNLFQTLSVCRRLLESGRKDGMPQPFSCVLTDNHVDIARLIDIAGTQDAMPVSIRYAYVGCPVSIRHEKVSHTFMNWIAMHARNMTITCPEPSQDSHRFLDQAEMFSNILTGYIWLSMRFPELYVHHDLAVERRNEYNGIIMDFMSRNNMKAMNIAERKMK